MIVEVAYGTREIKVNLSFEDRKRLSITVNPDCTVVARAPSDSSLPLVRAKLRKRARWISGQLSFFERHQPITGERQYISGETHRYLGRQYRLRIRTGSSGKVRLIGRFFEMEMPDTADREKARSLLVEWYEAHSKEILESRLALYLPKFLLRGARLRQARYRRIKRRWGSCSPSGVITLNTELAKAPLVCIDYVIIHELCHLLRPLHDKGFYRLLGALLPDYEERKDRLEQVFL